MGQESWGPHTIVEGHNVLGSNSYLASSANIHLTARVVTEVAESEDIRTTGCAFRTEQLRM